MQRGYYRLVVKGSEPRHGTAVLRPRRNQSARLPNLQRPVFEYENTGMVGTVADRIDNGQLQLYCVDSVDGESWYNKHAHPYWRVQRHMQYERYIVNDVLTLMGREDQTPRLIATGCQLWRLSRRELLASRRSR